MLPSEQRLAAQNGAILVGAVAATAATFVVVAVALPGEHYIHRLFFDRTWIQYATTLVFWITMAILASRHLHYRREAVAYHTARQTLDESNARQWMNYADADPIRKLFLGEQAKPFERSVTYNRIVTGLDRLRKTKSTKALEDYFSNRSEVDATELETSYANVRYLLWLIPTIGFIGTVMGIGVGLSGFADILVEAQDFEQVKAQLPNVTRSLGTAFDTTLLALALSTLAVFYMSFLFKQQEQLLTEVDSLCLDEVCALFQEHSHESLEVIKAVEQTTDKLLTSMNGNRALLVKIVSDLPRSLSEELKAQMDALQEDEETAGEDEESPTPSLAAIQDLVQAQQQTNVEILGVLRRLHESLGRG